VDDRTTAQVRRPAILALAVLVAAATVLGLAAAAGAAAPPTASATLPEAAYAGPLAGAARATLGLPQPGSGGWIWPIGTEDFQGWSGWLEPRGAYVHVAQDMPCSYGHAVYAIGDGVVFISRADAGGYGVGGAPGGCIIITHTTAAGTKFDALYGHVSGLLVKEGERVQAGQLIARVNGCRHLHFSTHPGAKYRDGNPYAGHVPKSWADHGGYVDPVQFLKANPRSAAYEPPALPRTEVTTTSAPLQYGAADGAAYWTEEGAAGSVTWRQDLATGERRTLAAGEAAPAFDARRYGVELLAAPALGFAVTDHLPAVALAAEHDTPPWGAEAELTAKVTNAAGAPLQGAIVRLQLLQSSWQNVGLAVTDPSGEAVFLYTPAIAASLRVAFAPPPEGPDGRDYLVARSRPATVTPHVALTTPRLPARVAAADLVTAAGDLLPRHPAGEHAVKLEFQRRGAGGDWVSKLTVAAVNRDKNRGETTRYVGHARLTAGSWRVRATSPAGAQYALTTSSWRTFSVE
jgi:murein DD-endopeptidase MepM/ murein hydrolase activator NlpD